MTHVAIGRKGTPDDEVWQMVCAGPALLITRDHHFTDPARFDAKKSNGIVHLRRGNLAISREVALVARFFENHSPDEYRRRLVTLSPGKVRIR